MGVRAMLKGVACALLVLASVAVHSAPAEDDEHYTIFLGLDNYHVAKDGSHEILTPEEGLGEHDNVVVHMSEDEMRMHMDKHDTHDCEHPEMQKEIVSFVQENMYETTTASAKTIRDTVAPSV